MSNTKNISQILPPPPTHMVGDGFRVQNFFPGGHRITKEISPFYLMDYNAPWELPPSDKQRGVGVHPHRGFETVTIAFQGSVAHHDSAGNSGVIGPGDVQWMTAGSGVLHKEYHEEKFTKKGGVFHMVQLWVNLPAKYKMTPPKYQGITFEQQGKLTLPNNAGSASIIAGELNGVKGPADTFTPINMLTMKLEANADFSFEIPANHNTGILVIAGNGYINDVNARNNDFVLFKKDGTTIQVKSSEPMQLLVLSGEPIDEPIAQYGPFLMNTQAELQQALEDFNNGKFGQLAD